MNDKSLGWVIEQPTCGIFGAVGKVLGPTDCVITPLAVFDYSLTVLFSGILVLFFFLAKTRFALQPRLLGLAIMAVTIGILKTFVHANF